VGLEALRRLEYRGYDSGGVAWYKKEEGADIMLLFFLLAL